MCSRHQLIFVAFPNGVGSVVLGLALATVVAVTPSADAMGGMGVLASRAAAVASSLMLVAGVLGPWAARSHNKALLLLVVVTGTISAGCHAATWLAYRSAALGSPAAPAGCLQGPLRGGSEPADAPDCAAYLSSAPVSRAFRLWMRLHTAAVGGDEVSMGVLRRLEEGNVCCGFGPPSACRGGWLLRNATDAWPVRSLQRSDAPALEALQACGARAPSGLRWYPASRFCSARLGADRPEFGCPHVLSVSPVCDDPRGGRPGCADAFVARGVGMLWPLGLAALLALPAQLWCCCTACCLLVHRKYSDVVPAPVFRPLPEHALYGESSMYPQPTWEAAAKRLLRQRKAAAFGHAGEPGS